MEWLSRTILGFELDRAVRVAFDGVDTSGKTTLADEVAGRIQSLAGSCVRISVDDFLRPTQERHRRGQLSPDCYYQDSFDLSALAQRVTGDDASDAFVVDGVFLLRPELSGLWDFSVHLDVPDHVAMDRALVRDQELMGSKETVEERYRLRYLPAHALYHALAQPAARADVVIDNTDFDSPIVRKGGIVES